MRRRCPRNVPAEGVKTVGAHTTKRISIFNALPIDSHLVLPDHAAPVPIQSTVITSIYVKLPLLTDGCPRVAVGSRVVVQLECVDLLRSSFC
jgi:hypothetical protein